MNNMGIKQIRAEYDDDCVVVYQAYSPPIAAAALERGTFAPPFKRSRMTWIKPSFLWMAYRSGWATKENQEVVLRVEIRRAGLEWALEHSALSHFDPTMYESREAWNGRVERSPVRIQWDPERSLTLAPLDQRSIQIGLGGDAVDRYVDEWIVDISDDTPRFRAVADLIADRRFEEAEALLPSERPYPLTQRLQHIVGASPS